ncbi:MAG: hypothetical protein LC708_04310 [Actinobacteria bacterium]|nr:hypothetical protein [Actinomycetota bacterium]
MTVDEGAGTAVFTVTLSAASGETVTVNFATADGTAAGGDYTAASGTVTFLPGETAQTVTVAVTGDALDEANETFAVNLSGAAGAPIRDGQGVGTILDDDAAPSVGVDDVSVVEGRSGTTYAVFTVSLFDPLTGQPAASGQTVTVRFATANGTATTSNNDYTATSGTVTFAPGETTKTVRVAVRGDRKQEADETFLLNLSSPTNAVLADAQGVGTILNDD